MLVKDIMVKNVVTVSPLATIRDALKLMRQHQVKCLVVEQQHAHDAYGILTYGDVLKSIMAEDGDIDLLNVYDLYSKPALIISAELEVKYAARMMVNMGIHRLLVTSSNQLTGIVTTHDLVGSILELADS